MAIALPWAGNTQGDNRVISAVPDARSGLSANDVKTLGPILTTMGFVIRVNISEEVSQGDSPEIYQIKQEVFGNPMGFALCRLEEKESPGKENVSKEGGKITEYDSPGVSTGGQVPSASVNYKGIMVFQTWAVDKNGKQNGPSFYWLVD